MNPTTYAMLVKPANARCANCNVDVGYCSQWLPVLGTLDNPLCQPCWKSWQNYMIKEWMKQNAKKV